MDKKKKNLMAVLGLLGIAAITIGTAYAWFSYSRNGSKENSISAGTIKLHYQEGNRRIELSDAVPMTDSQGMAQTNYFDFTVTSETSSTIEIPYYVTVRRSSDSETTLDSHVKVYLTKVDGNIETPVVLAANKYTPKFSELGTYTNPNITIPASEKPLFSTTVPINSSNYSQTYRLRMWIDESANFSAVKKYYCGTTEITQANFENNDYVCESGEKNTQDVYPFNDVSYTLTVNVYGEGQIAQATTVPTIPSCPGCRFVYNPETDYYFETSSSGPASILTASDTVADYTQIDSDKFLGFVLSDGDHGTIKRAFVCGIKRESTEAALETGTPFCFEGGLRDSEGGDATTRAIIYNNNRTVLQSLDPSCPETGDSPDKRYSFKWNSIHGVFYETGYTYLKDPVTTYGVQVMKCLVFNDSGKAVCRVES